MAGIMVTALCEPPAFLSKLHTHVNQVLPTSKSVLVSSSHATSPSTSRTTQDIRGHVYRMMIWVNTKQIKGILPPTYTKHKHIALSHLYGPKELTKLLDTINKRFINFLRCLWSSDSSWSGSPPRNRHKSYSGSTRSPLTPIYVSLELARNADPSVCVARRYGG